MMNDVMPVRCFRGRRTAQWLALTLVACLSTAIPMSGALAQHVVVLVNGLPITSLDVEQRTRLIMLSTKQKPAREKVIEELIDEKLKIKEARRYSLEAQKAEIDTAFANIAKRMGSGPDQLTKILESNGSSAANFKMRLSADLVWTKLVRGRYRSILEIRDKDILASLNAAEKDKVTGHEYDLRPILVVVPRGSPPAVIEAKRREAEALRSRFQGCDAGIAMARAVRDVAVRTPITRNAADLPPQLREVLEKTGMGRLTPPELTPNGIEMFALCDQRATSEDTPVMREARNKIVAERFEAKAKQYLEEIRRGAMIEYRE